ncbi:FGGY carbohydrate kinase domain-containing protein-like [Oenanthe melanoleuca]|uniref:FGGY carbohydrate kinase domain-containing protein-like n=1 Tax=Oenanthe melanoleuca TaxID=2939378 RepID=UPI0024C15920|nr:FGGY carbohydrate kinase domain-containing protein-like [Oenanthe melanoleuca]
MLICLTLCLYCLFSRSLCTVVCKWTYTSDRGWDDSFWKMIGLEDLVKDKYEKIGNHVLSPGEAVGEGLTADASQDLSLPEGIAVAASLIDAHAGGLGVIGADVKGHNLPCENQPITSRVAMICGTSSCHMGVSETPIFVPGVWGPYFSAMVPGLWLNEGGQSATGKLIDHVVRGHVAFPELEAKAAARSLFYSFITSLPYRLMHTAFPAVASFSVRGINSLIVGWKYLQRLSR